MNQKIIITLTTLLAGLIGLIVLINYLRDMPSSSSGVIKHTITSRPARFVLRIDKNVKNPYAMDLKMTGKINGIGILCMGSNDSVYNSIDTISNDFIVEYHADWYCDSCIVNYKPISATSGDLLIKYDYFALEDKQGLQEC